jgi:hypothetical protein
MKNSSLPASPGLLSPVWIAFFADFQLSANELMLCPSKENLWRHEIAGSFRRDWLFAGAATN